MKIQNALVSNILDRSQRYFAHVTTVTLSWRVKNIVVIGRVYFTLECFEFSSNFEFDRNMLSGTGARSHCSNWSWCSHIRTCFYSVTWRSRHPKSLTIILFFNSIFWLATKKPSWTTHHPLMDHSWRECSHVITLPCIATLLFLIILPCR